ncbi:ribonuclease H-like domain-containing protein [Tanacetum coccineum]
MSQPHPKGNFVPKAVLIKSGLKTLNTARKNFLKATISVNTARPINTAFPRPNVNCARPASNVFNRAHLHVRRPFNKFTTNKNSNFNEKVNTVKGTVTTSGPKVVVSNNTRNEANAVKASAYWIWRPKQKVLDHISRHNGALMNLKIFDYIDAQGISKSITKKLIDDLLPLEELKFNLFNVSQMFDKKNSVLFTDTKCVVLSPDFKLTDECHVLIKVPRKDNMYNIDLRNVFPQVGLTCFFAKATPDESNLWHRRLRHVNFKTMNKLVKGNLVMNQFCEMKGIKREFSITRTPQQNGVAERKNKILIEAAKTMLADSKLPTTF